MDDQQRKFVARFDSADTFTDEYFEKNVAKVIEHCAKTGRALVVGADGRPRMSMSIPIVDLPVLGD